MLKQPVNPDFHMHSAQLEVLASKTSAQQMTKESRVALADWVLLLVAASTARVSSNCTCHTTMLSRAPYYNVLSIVATQLAF